MAGSVKVTFDDGRTEIVPIRPAALMKAESHFRGQVPGIGGSLYIAWLSLGNGTPFDEWVETLAEAEDVREERPPLPSAPSPAG